MCGVSGMRTANAKWQYAYANLPSRREDPNREKAIRKIEETLKSMKKPDIVLVILSSDDKVIYSGIKLVLYSILACAMFPNNRI
jgi:eukaryotic translation initiation factor 2C